MFHNTALPGRGPQRQEGSLRKPSGTGRHAGDPRVAWTCVAEQVPLGEGPGPTCSEEEGGALAGVLPSILTLPPASGEPTPHPGAEPERDRTPGVLARGRGCCGGRPIPPRGLRDAPLVGRQQQQPQQALSYFWGESRRVAAPGPPGPVASLPQACLSEGPSNAAKQLRLDKPTARSGTLGFATCQWSHQGPPGRATLNQVTPEVPAGPRPAVVSGPLPC